MSDSDDDDDVDDDDDDDDDDGDDDDGGVECVGGCYDRSSLGLRPLRLVPCRAASRPRFPFGREEQHHNTTTLVPHREEVDEGGEQSDGLGA